MNLDLAFEWDDANRDHIARHEVPPEEAEQVIGNDPLDIEAESVDGEEQWASIGLTDQGRYLVVVTTFRPPCVRVTTAFAAPKSLIDSYLLQRGT